MFTGCRCLCGLGVSRVVQIPKLSQIDSNLGPKLRISHSAMSTGFNTCCKQTDHTITNSQCNAIMSAIIQPLTVCKSESDTSGELWTMNKCIDIYCYYCVKVYSVFTIKKTRNKFILTSRLFAQADQASLRLSDRSFCCFLGDLWNSFKVLWKSVEVFRRCGGGEYRLFV